ncbi:MAG: hypothetical protein M3Y53_03500 [Thermoproteota archaeon]|nr:hypothetical protein [Thermoproteota archaeon]
MLPLAVKSLGKTRYPDIEISYLDLIVHLEMKTSSVKEKSSIRYFYYTNGEKIKQNARHLPLDIAVTQENPNYWKVDKWALSDLSKLTVRLRNEFNASKSDLMDECKDNRILLSLVFKPYCKSTFTCKKATSDIRHHSFYFFFESQIK